MGLVERDTELLVLKEMYADCTHGRGGVVVVSGAVARGKTELLHTFAEHVAESGGLMLTATGSRTEQALPLGVIQQLFQWAPLPPAHAERVAELLHQAASLTMPLDAQYETVRQPFVQMVHGLWTTLLNLTGSGPVVLGIDDVQYADSLSLQCLLYLTNRLRSARVLMVLNETTGPQPTNQLFKAELLRQPRCRRIRLDALSPRGVTLMLAEHLDAPTVRQLAPACYGFSGGNPLLVRAVIEDYLASAKGIQTDGTLRLVPGEAFGETVLACLHRCGPGVLQVANGIAVLDESGSSSLLGALVGMPNGSTAQAVQALNTIGLLDSYRFRHSAARTAVLNHMTTEARADMHLRAAELLYRDDAAATTVAEHLVVAGGNPGPWAVGVLQDAAVRAMATDHVTVAVDCLNLACRICSDNQQRAALTMMLARAEVRSNPSVSGRYLFRLTAALREGDLHGHHAVAAIEYLLWYGRANEAEQALQQLFGTPDALDNETMTALKIFRLWVSSSYPWLLDHVPVVPAEPASREIMPVSVAIDPRLQAVTSLTAVLTSGPDENVVTTAEQILQRYRLTDATLDTLGAALTTLIYADRLDIAIPWCDSLLSEATTRTDPVGRALFSIIRAEIVIRRGDLPAAENYTRSALTLVPAQSLGVGVGMPLAGMLFATTAMGKFDDAEWVLNQTVPEAMFHTRFGLHYRHARGHYHLATGRLHAALGDFQICGQQMIDWRIDQPGLVPWRVDAAQVLLGLGEHDQAKGLVEDQLARTGTAVSRSRGVALRVLAAASELKQRPRLLREAADVLRTCCDPFELAKTLADLGEAHQALGEPARARMLVRQAWHLAKRCQAEPLCQKLMPSRRAADSKVVNHGPVEDADGIVTLSDAECRVAAQAARGLTNREIARHLYLTVSTVEQHLTRVYRKLNVNGRRDLPNVAATE